MKTIRLSEYADRHSVKYKTAWSWFRAGLIKGARQLPSGTIVIDIDDDTSQRTDGQVRVALYARTSSSANKKMLSDQLERLESYAAARGYTIVESAKEFGSGLNDQRPALTKILQNIDDYDKIIVEHRDRLTRFGFNWFQVFTGGKIEVVNEVPKESEQELTDDLIAIIHSFSARSYGLRRKKRKIVSALNSLAENDCCNGNGEVE